MKHLMIGLIKLYRRYISPLKAPCCRFTPSCSAYALEAFAKRGFFVGFILTVWRILRCNPFSKGGYDPVPERGLRNPKPSGCAEEANCRHRDNDSSSDAKDTLADIEHSENDGSIEDAPHSEDSIDE